MWVFYILIFIPIMVQHIKIKGIDADYKKNNQSALIIFFVFLTALVAFRHESVGNDTRNYIYYFKAFAQMNWGRLANESIEFGFSYFNKIVSLLSKEPQVFLAVAAIAVSAMIYPTYRRLCIDTSLTIVLFCIMSTFVMMFSGIRQMLAVGLGVIAYEFTRNKKLIPFMIIVVISITIHTSAFMLVLMYPLYHANITKKWLFAVIPAMGIIFVFNKPIFAFLSVILERYTEYEIDVLSTGAYTIMILFVAFSVYSFIIPDETSLDKETIGLRNFLLLSLVIQMFAPLNPLAMRMHYYYIIFIPLLLPKIIESRSERWKQVAVFSRHAMLAFLGLYFFVSAYSNTHTGGGLHVFPYHFFWEKV